MRRWRRTRDAAATAPPQGGGLATVFAMPVTCAFRFPAQEVVARHGLAALMSRLRRQGLTDPALQAIEIAVTEAVNNVVEHAYCGGTGEILLRARLREGRLVVWICDTGGGMPDGRMPQGRAPSLAVAPDRLPEGGFGWFLIRQLCSALRYDRRRGHNLLVLRFDLG